MAKERRPIVVVLLSIVTLGIYAIYWLFQAFKQVLEDKESSHVLWFLGMFVPILNLIIIWKFCSEVEEYSGGEHSGVLLFLLYIVFAPAAIYLIQVDLNAGLNM